MAVDNNFNERANQYIRLANSHCDGTVSIGNVRDSFMFGLARFNSWVAATERDSGAELKAHRQEIIDGLIARYRSMLEQHLDDHINNFAQLMTPPKS